MRAALSASRLAAHHQERAAALVLAELLHAIQVGPAAHETAGTVGGEDVVEVPLDLQPVSLDRRPLANLCLNALPELVAHLAAEALQVVVFKPGQALGFDLFFKRFQPAPRGWICFEEIDLVAACQLFAQAFRTEKKEAAVALVGGILPEHRADNISVNLAQLRSKNVFSLFAIPLVASAQAVDLLLAQPAAFQTALNDGRQINHLPRDIVVQYPVEDFGRRDGLTGPGHADGLQGCGQNQPVILPLVTPGQTPSFSSEH